MRPGWLLVCAGVATAALALAGLVVASEREPPPREDWRPACVDSLQARYGHAAVVSRTDPGMTGLVLIGLDASGSNTAALADQVEAAERWVARGDLSVEVGVLLVSRASDASAAADLWLPATPRSSLERHGPCEGTCRASSLFEQRCLDQLERAMDARQAELEREASRDLDEARARRTRAMARWAGQTRAADPTNGTALVRFWRKVADLPRVRTAATPARVILLSDLAETDPGARRWLRRLDRDPTCRAGSPLPRLDGVEITLLQTVRERSSEPWRERWRVALTCAGAQVTDYRWTPSLPLEEYVPRYPSQGSTNSATVTTIETTHTALPR